MSIYDHLSPGRRLAASGWDSACVTSRQRIAVMSGVFRFGTDDRASRYPIGCEVCQAAGAAI
jgi:hypothetical protein